MKFVHEFDSSSWKTMHRLVCVLADGTRIEGEFALYEDFAFLSDALISGKPEAGEPSSGWMIVTDYYSGTFPRLTRFDSREVEIEESDVVVLGKKFEATLEAAKDDAEAEIENAASLCPCFECKDARANNTGVDADATEHHLQLRA